MGETYTRPALASRERVTELMEAGEPFAVVEDTIDETTGLGDDAKAALWLLAFSMRDPVEQQHDAHAHLDALA